MIKSTVLIRKKAKGQQRDQKYHYPVCPSCGNDYKEKLKVCIACNKLVCDTCISNEEVHK